MLRSPSDTVFFSKKPMIYSVTAPGELQIQSPAKINLFLQVTGKRPDGYHTLNSLMCCIGLYDTLRLSINAPGHSVSCSDPRVPDDETNLAFRAADLFYRKLNMESGVSIRIDKQIPVAAGLGGGSSNAAAVLLGLNRFFDFPLSTDDLSSLGLSLGADVPFFIRHRPATVTGIGERIEPYQGLPPLKVLLIYPGFGVSTAEIFKNVNLGLTKHEKKISLFPFNNKAFDIRQHVCNDLEAVAIAKYPEICVAKDVLIRQNADAVLMSGSGSTVFGLFFDPQEARRSRDRISLYPNWRLFLTDLLV